MENFLNIFVRSIFVDNMIFAFFLGMCSYLAVSKNVKTSIGLGVAVTFVLLITLPVNYLLQVYVLNEGALSWLGEGFAKLDLSYLSFILFIAVIAAITQLVEMVVEKYTPALYASLGIFLPLIAVNCAIMGCALFMQQRIGLPATDPKALTSIADVLAYALGSGFGWILAIVGLAAIREKMEYNAVPATLKGLGITFIVVGLMAMAFLCFSGLKIN
ncbi:MAG: NADH:ubiquinone reductase (Na(+)-transporting) subunit E [Prevotellaceae bacterium]|jgi:Na+-transporting NADH:ubiquinone oxidoreductase subunit E|nr:NADH:ubiquinone reductase (Na(+)-transporting) subunit E [Prevotellaceae bacterium]